MDKKDSFIAFMIFLAVVQMALYFYNDRGLPAESVVVENIEEGPGSKIKLEPIVAANMRHTYDGTSKELPFCLFGHKKENGGYVVNDMDFPRIISSEKYRTEFSDRSCMQKDDYLGMVHNHEEGSCFPSDRDLFTFFSSRMDIFLIYCRNNEEKVYVGVTRDIFNPQSKQQ